MKKLDGKKQCVMLMAGLWLMVNGKMVDNMEYLYSILPWMIMLGLLFHGTDYLHIIVHG